MPGHMVSQLNSIAAILISTVFFLMGNGLVNTLTPLRGQLEGYSALALGSLGTCYYGGFVIGCIVGPRLVARGGHVRAFSSAAALAAVSTLLQPVATATVIWLLLRVVS